MKWAMNKCKGDCNPMEILAFWQAGLSRLLKSANNDKLLLYIDCKVNMNGCHSKIIRGERLPHILRGQYIIAAQITFSPNSVNFNPKNLISPAVLNRLVPPPAILSPKTHSIVFAI